MQVKEKLNEFIRKQEIVKVSSFLFFKRKLIQMTENRFVKIIEREKERKKEVHLLIMEARRNLLKIPFSKKKRTKSILAIGACLFIEMFLN